jgi:hypothetical protein
VGHDTGLLTGEPPWAARSNLQGEAGGEQGTTLVFYNSFGFFGRWPVGIGGAPGGTQ